MKSNFSKAIGTFVFLFVLSSSVFAQGTLKGFISDASSGETLPGASITTAEGLMGTITMMDGNFSLELPAGDYKVKFSYVGYLSQSKEISIKKGQVLNLGTIGLETSSVGIDEVMVIASIGVDRQTPVALSNIKPEFIEEKLGTQEFPEILKSTPSVYATRQGGGYGDSRINIRGFNQRNVAVMINGVPVNDMENGWVYWSNWAGLADVTRNMQVQRGLGASKIAIPSIGGTINILTKTTDMEKGGKILTGFGNDGFQKQSMTLSTGLLDNGWAVTFSGAHSKGDGWADGLWHKSYSYYLGISKRINDNHMLALSVFGAPQQHGQRTTTMSASEWDLVDAGRKFNKDWGYRDGQIMNTRRNFYHKPQAILNHFWTINDDMNLNTAVYASIGTGGGTGPYGSGSGKIYAGDVNGDYRISQLVDFDRIVLENKALGHKGSDAILRSSVNNHKWYGALSYFNHQITENLKYQVGIDARYYIGQHYREVSDLLGGLYHIDNSDLNNPNQVSRIGDKIAYHNDGIVGWLGGFGQIEYVNDGLSAYANLSLSNKQYQRIDYFRKLEGDQETEWVPFNGFSFKGGVNYNLNDQNNVFANAGYFETQPGFDAVFLSNSNDRVNANAANEKISSFELGYGFQNHFVNIKINGFYTNWLDKSFTKFLTYVDGEGNTETLSANILGVSSNHKGIEFEAKFKPTKNFNIDLMASVGDYRWTNNLENQPIFDDNNVQIDAVNIYIKDVHVGDAAQTTGALMLSYLTEGDIKIGLDFNYFGNYYAEFDPLSRTVATAAGAAVEDSWKTPDFSTIDFSLSYRFDLGPYDAVIYGKVNNLLDTEYISDADDGSDHSWSTSRYYYGIGRTWSGSLIINF